MAINVHFV